MSDGKRVVVTGGSGLIGRALTEELVADGYEVVVLSRSPGRVEGLPPGARAVGWDAESADGWAREADGARAIVNLAGENLADGRWTEERKRRIVASRVDATRAVVEAVRTVAEPPEVLLQGSAVGFYGDGGEQVLDESAPRGEGFLADVTVAWEEASAPVEERGVRRALLRTGVVLASEGGALPKMALPFKMFAGGPVGSGKQWVPWIHRRDEARAIRHLLEAREAAGPFNLVAPEPVRNAELARALGETLRRPALVPAPAPALRLALGELADTVLASQRAVPQRLEATGFRFLFPSIRPALADLLD